MAMKEIKKVFLKIWKRKVEKKIKAVAISVLVILSLACAMGEKPAAAPPREKLDMDYTYLLLNGDPVFRVYTPQQSAKPRTPTIVLILD
jgi:hypothetical protein